MRTIFNFQFCNFHLISNVQFSSSGIAMEINTWKLQIN